MPVVSAVIDQELYDECREHSKWRYGANARMSDYLRAAVVQLARRDTASRSKSDKAVKVPKTSKDAMPVQYVAPVASGGPDADQ